MTIYREIVENIRMNLQGCDTEENVQKHLTHQQMVFMLHTIYHLTKEIESSDQISVATGIREYNKMLDKA